MSDTHAGTGGDSGEACFERLRPRLDAVPAEDAALPWMDPSALALSALVVADFMRRPENLRRARALGELGYQTESCIADLWVVARVVLYAVSKLDARPSSAPQVTERVRTRAKALKRTMTSLLERHLYDSDEAFLWLEVIRQGTDDDDSLVLDLRCLALLYRQHAGALETREKRDFAKEARGVCDAADALERALVPADAEWRGWLARAWTLLVPLYEEVCHIGRFLVRGEPRKLPSVVSVARVRRHRLAVERAGVAPRAEDGDIEPAVPSSRRTPIPREPRRSVELAVTIFTDANVYVGFTQNLSSGGLFISTYEVRPIGTKVRLSLSLPWHPSPLQLDGEVRWTREHSPSTDDWPGMGIQLEGLTPEEDALVSKCMKYREPIFYADG